jgi:iron complex transport system substrate-binding protein
MDRAPEPSRDPRVVSLIASATEIVHALGAGSTQVARSHECDWPPAVLDLPALTQPKFKVEGSSRAIDKAVRALVEQGLAVYEVDADALMALAPDVILTQDQCEVCAVSLAGQKAGYLDRPPAHRFCGRTMVDVTDIGRVAAALKPSRRRGARRMQAHRRRRGRSRGGQARVPSVVDP